ncbi:hypothetical protein A0J61_07064 [Choanephora cucurbitarum]|uniref:Uncharacterized protein n=1 Tax=Choanephora cucurbitarum TaxID=101091 RepID=A0A1C7N6Z0_9FUNG|nr:hypothetical protein A0J61_07064 [Choanephora cucurbitarum]
MDMPYHILPAHPNQEGIMPSPKMRQQRDDVNQLLVSLRARLGFAQFKMNQGWESSTLLDVEQLWRQKQQKFISDLPKPRFTQRDIIDKKVVMPSSGTKHQSKKAKLMRTYSFPAEKRKTIRQHYPSHSQPIYLMSNSLQPPTHTPLPPTSMPPVSPDTSSSLSSAMEEEDHFQCPSPPMRLRNSLDYLSYAIAMTEQQQPSSQPLPDVSEVEPHLTEEEEDYTILDKETDASPPSSPVTSAAKAIMMFVNNNQPPPSDSHTQH